MSEDSKDFNPPQAAAKQADAPPKPESPRAFLEDTINVRSSLGTHNAGLRELLEAKAKE